MQQKTIVVGKRVTVGTGIGGALAFGAAIWDMMNPENKIPAPAIAGLQAFIVMLVQIWVANALGITTHDDSGEA